MVPVSTPVGAAPVEPRSLSLTAPASSCGVVAVKELLGDVKQTDALGYAPPALVRSMGRLTRSQKRGKNKSDTVFSLQIPVNWLTPKVDNAIYKVNDRYLLASWNSSVLTNIYFGFNFQVSAMGQITALQSLFDQYRIVKVEAMVYPETNLVAAGSGNTPGVLHSVIDYDDNTPLTTEQQALDYQNCMTSMACDGHHRSWKPHCAIAAYQGALTAFANVESPWIDAAYPNVQHYGLKTVNTIASVASPYVVYVTLYTEWRNLR